MNRLAIFDCDGTLVDSQANICLAMEECFLRMKLDPPAREVTRRVVGLSLVEAIRTLLPNGEADFHDVLVEEYKRAFLRMRQAGRVEEPLFEGTAELLAALENDGWVLGVATGKSDRGLAHCLDGHGIRGRFVTLQTADRHPSKPHPSMIEAALAEAGAARETSMMIGDTSYDIAMAAAANVRGIGVGWGYHSAAELVAAGADYVADHPSDILRYTKALV